MLFETPKLAYSYFRLLIVWWVGRQLDGGALIQLLFYCIIIDSSPETFKPTSLV